MILLENRRLLRYASHSRVSTFEFYWADLFSNLRTHSPGCLQYFAVFLLRKKLYALIVFYLDGDEFTTIQVYVNILLSWAFMIYLIVQRPFLDNVEQRINLLNEATYYVVSCFFLSFTNFNPDVDAKLMMGWIVVAICIMNLIWPNGTVMVRAIWPDIKDSIWPPKNEKEEAAKNKKELFDFGNEYKYVVNLQPGEDSYKLTSAEEARKNFIK